MKLNDYKNLVEYAELTPYRGRLKKPDIRARGENSLCGDSLAIDFKIRNGKISDAKFEHKGCALSAAAAAMLLDYARGKKYEKVVQLPPRTLLKIIGAPVSHARLPCALLPLAVLKSAKNKKKPA